jgi:ribosome maturation factor RimP
MLFIAKKCIHLRLEMKHAGGQMSPILLPMEIEQIRSLITPVLEEIGGYVVLLRVTPGGQVALHADTLTGIKLEELTRLSRAIESGLDREVEDFSLEVSSPGMDQPLRVPMQYIRHRGKTVKVIYPDGKELVGILTQSDDSGFEVETTARVPKPIGKGKITVTEKHPVLFDEIKETRLELSF